MKVLKNIHKDNSYTYEDFDKNKHDINIVSCLLYETEKNLIDTTCSQNHFHSNDFENLKVIVDDNKNIIGIVEYYINLPEFTLRDLWKSDIKDLLSYLCMCRIEENDFYIAKLAVNEKYRRHKYGTQILEDLEQYAKNLNFERMILDVEPCNLKALNFYKNFGFVQYKMVDCYVEYMNYFLCHLKYDLVKE